MATKSDTAKPVDPSQPVEDPKDGGRPGHYTPPMTQKEAEAFHEEQAKKAAERAAEKAKE